MPTRRTFLKNAAMGAVMAAPSVAYAMENFAKGGPQKISLAQWSLHRAFEKGALDPALFSTIARKDYGLEAIEYVNGLYKTRGADEAFWTDMKRRADGVGVKSLLIMVDDEGDLGHPEDKQRKKSVENHFKWVNAATLLGCHSVRVNAFGEGSRETFRASIVDGMGRLAEYAAKQNINIIIENHGLYSSDGALMAGIMKEVNLPNFGSLPDFGNWCLSAKWGTTQIPCERVYDRYQGVAELLPFAKAVSAKSYDFDSKGDETRIDYYRMLKMVRESGYTGYIGIEYEGERLSEPDGIRATKSLIERAGAA